MLIEYLTGRRVIYTRRRDRYGGQVQDKAIMILHKDEDCHEDGPTYVRYQLYFPRDPLYSQEGMGEYIPMRKDEELGLVAPYVHLWGRNARGSHSFDFKMTFDHRDWEKLGVKLAAGERIRRDALNWRFGGPFKVIGGPAPLPEVNVIQVQFRGGHGSGEGDMSGNTDQGGPGTGMDEEEDPPVIIPP